MLELTTIRKRLVGNYADWFVQQKLFEFRMPMPSACLPVRVAVQKTRQLL